MYVTGVTVIGVTFLMNNVAHTEEAMLSGGTYEFYFVTLCKINKHNKKLVHFTVVCFNNWQCDFFIHE